MLLQDMVSPFRCRKHLTAAAGRAEAHSSRSHFHLRCTGNAKLEFYGNYANSHPAVLHHGHVRAPIPLDASTIAHRPALPG